MDSVDRLQILKDAMETEFLDRSFLHIMKLRKAEMAERLDSDKAARIGRALLDSAGPDGRISTKSILTAVQGELEELSDVPPEGWLEHCYSWLRHRLYPHIPGPEDPDRYSSGRSVLLQMMRAVFSYERRVLKFNPTKDFDLLSDKEIEDNGYTPEYFTMRKAIRSCYVYEFMRIGIEVTPFNTLGHIAGVHYTAMYVGRQLKEAGVPVDLGLISAAAASHDIGKYGCRKQEEKRVPHLHYYYTDICLNRFGMPGIAHIAANHSTWDLELENLSVESLLLIYADFRVKSTRNENREEIIHFYTLDDAFDVILSKLENVDAAKEHRYRKVYNKLKDFEDYMIEHGVQTDIPEDYPVQSQTKPVPVKREYALLHGRDVVEQLKFGAIDHNINLMSRFNDPADFASLLESARSVSDWRATRGYITILGEYSTYMTEEQKSMTLSFLYEALSHRDSDVREQAAGIMGKIIATYRSEYKKELPADVPAPDVNATNIHNFRDYLQMIAFPDRKYTEQHQKWIVGSLRYYVRSTLTTCRPDRLHLYFDVLSELLGREDLSEELTVELGAAALMLGVEPTDDFKRELSVFAKREYGRSMRSVDLVMLRIMSEYDDSVSPDFIRKEHDKLMELDGSKSHEQLISSMFLDDLKANTPWVVKIANINYMLDTLGESSSNHLHIATHLTNLIKVSETVAVRRAAGSALVSMVSLLPLDQRNELVIELFNGLEIGDYQFSRFIPDYLGVVMLFLPPKELDETIDELQNGINAGGEKFASAALTTVGTALENYSMYGQNFKEDEKVSMARKRRLLGMLLKGFSYYDPAISQEAFRVLGLHVFGSGHLSLEEKGELFYHCAKKLLALLPDVESDELSFYNDAAILNDIYRFISLYQSEVGDFAYGSSRKVAFFPGTFDPFSLGHKAIATTIRNAGFEVYLALDEFSWSKKTQPRMLRRKIISMSVADEENIFLFPEDISINIANNDDLGYLRKLFRDSELYIAVGSDVVKNASSYKSEPSENSIHSFNHIIFAREMRNDNGDKRASYPIAGKVLELTLSKYYEDISSTRIRDNIDLGRDISDLIDPVAQNYIYANNLYSREPTYKHVLQARELYVSEFSRSSGRAVSELREELVHRGYRYGKIANYLNRSDVKTVYIRSGVRTRRISAFAAAHWLRTHDLLSEIGDPKVCAHIRKHASGSVAVIGAFFIGHGRSISNLSQILITEILSALIAKDFAYAVYHPVDQAGMNPSVIDALRRQGFVNISHDPDNPVYAVDIKAPVVIFRDAETVIKAPLNKNRKVMKVLDNAHLRLLRTFTELFPGRLILSYNTNVIHSRIIELVAGINGVSTTPDPEKHRGPYLAVPFGKALSDVAVPNTVTKDLHTEKYFARDLHGFTIRESRNYGSLDNQIRTLASFNRPALLIDDLLHKGYRMNIIYPMLQKHHVKVAKVVTGVMTGNARDNMEMRGIEAESAYFLPTISMWLNERDCYPFIGGDSIDGTADSSINFILPYTTYNFVGRTDPDKVYKYSKTCLENAYDIMRVLEQEYRSTFEKKLTLGRLAEVISSPRRPDLGEGLTYDENIAPSVYIKDAMIKAERLHNYKEK